MFTKEQITELHKPIINAVKKDVNYAWNILRDKKKEAFIPEYYPGYKTMVEHYEKVLVHTEKDYFPEKLFAKRSPNQTKDEAEYIRHNYKQVTLPFFLDYISTVTRAFSDPNCGVEFYEDSDSVKKIDKTFQKYIESEIKEYGSIEAFMQGIIPSIKAQDAMGVITVKPNDFAVKVDEVSGELIEDQTEFDTPVPYYYPCKNVVGHEEGVYYFIELDEKSIVEYGNQKTKIGRIYEFYDNENIWRITQVGKYSDFEFTYEIYYSHQEGVVPVTRLKGIPRIYNNNIFWTSPILYVTDILDLVLLNASNLQISINTCVYPYRIMYGDICEFQGKDETGAFISCIDGFITDSQGIKKTCSSCGGTGLKSRLSPMGVMLIKPSTRDNDGELKASNKPMEFVSPSTETLEFLRSKIAEDLYKAENILHLNAAKSMSKPQGSINQAGNDSATQIVSELKALYAFVKTVSDQTSDIYQFVLDRIGWQRYGNDYKGATYRYPKTYDFATQMDYVIQLGDAIKSGAPPFVLFTIIENYLKSLYQDDKDAGDAFKLIVETDRLLTLSEDAIQVKLSTGQAEKWEAILHTSAPMFVLQLSNDFQPKGVESDGEEAIDSFFDLPMQDQKNQLIEMAKKKADEVKAQQSTQQASLINDIANKDGATTGGG